MKRVIKVTVPSVVVLVIIIAAPIASAILGRQSPADGVEVNGIRIVKDGIVSMGVIPISESTVALIDAGNDKSGKAILAELSRRKLGPDAVKAIFLTHGHQDHTGGIALFRNAQVMSLEREVAMVEGREGGHGPL